MRTLLASVRRILIALVCVGAVVFGSVFVVRGLRNDRLDRTYARELTAAGKPAAQQVDRELNRIVSGSSTFLCEKRAGVPVSEIVVRLAAQSAPYQANWERSHLNLLEDVEAPARWQAFHSLVVQRHELLLAHAQHSGAANLRAVEVAASARPWTQLGIAESLARDVEFRTERAAAEEQVASLRDLDKDLRDALPDGYRRAAPITDELDQPERAGVIDFEGLYGSATMPIRQAPVVARTTSALGAAVPATGSESPYRMPPRQTTSAAAFAVCATRKYDPEYSLDHPDELPSTDPVSGMRIAAPPAPAVVAQ